MRKFDLGNGYVITVEETNRGFTDDYKITVYEDGRMLDVEYGNKEYIEYQYEVTL